MTLNHMMLNLRKGVEFADIQGTPFRIQIRGESETPWLFYKNADGGWVSLRQANQIDINTAAAQNSPRRA